MQNAPEVANSLHEDISLNVYKIGNVANRRCMNFDIMKHPKMTNQYFCNEKKYTYYSMYITICFGTEYTTTISTCYYL